MRFTAYLLTRRWVERRPDSDVRPGCSVKHVVEPTECYGEGRLIMYIAEPTPSVNKNGSVHEWRELTPRYGPASRTVRPLNAEPGETARSANHRGWGL